MSLFKIFEIASSGVTAQGQRLNATASNLANADSAAGPDGKAYQARQVVFQTVQLDRRDRRGRCPALCALARAARNGPPDQGAPGAGGRLAHHRTGARPQVVAAWRNRRCGAGKAVAGDRAEDAARGDGGAARQRGRASRAARGHGLAAVPGVPGPQPDRRAGRAGVVYGAACRRRTGHPARAPRGQWRPPFNMRFNHR